MEKLLEDNTGIKPEHLRRENRRSKDTKKVEVNAVKSSTEPPEHPSPKHYFHFRPDPSEISSPLLSRALGETNAEESKKIAWQLFEKLHETFYRAK